MASIHGVFPELAFVKHLCTSAYEFRKITRMPKLDSTLSLYKNSREVYYVTLGFPADSPPLFSWATEVRETCTKNNIFKCQHRVNSSNILKGTLSAETCSDVENHWSLGNQGCSQRKVGRIMNSSFLNLGIFRLKSTTLWSIVLIYTKIVKRCY